MDLFFSNIYIFFLFFYFILNQLGSKIHNSLREDHYGESFSYGDVIGCYIYLDDNTLRNKIIFYKNGISQGIAFEGHDIKPGIYFPAISMFTKVN
jgi:hypothetical protein